MSAEPAPSFRLVVSANPNEPAPGHHAASKLLREALTTTDIVRYARQLWLTPHNRIRFLLELPASRRWVGIELTAEYAAGAPVTLVSGHTAELPHRLTTRELEVLTLVAAGHSNPAIAEALFTSPRTVSTQVETVRNKLQANSRTSAGVLAVQQGWLRMPMPVPPDLLGSLDIAALLTGTEQTAGTPARPLTQISTPTPPRPIRLALAYPSSGPARSDGAQSRNGALLAIEEVNLRGGIRGRQIEPVLIDADIYHADGVRQTFHDIRDDDVHGVLMSYVFDEVTALSCAAKLGVPVLHTMTSRRHLDSVRSDAEQYQALFQCVPAETNYGPGLVRFLSLLDHVSEAPTRTRTVRFIETPADSGQIADRETRELLHSHGWSITGIEPFTHDPGALAALAESLLANPPTVLVITEFIPSELASLLLTLHQSGCPSVIYTVYTPSVPEFISQMGEAAEGMVWATVSGTYNDPYGAAFRESFAQKFGDQPGYSQAGLAYDMVHVLAAAWKQLSDPSDLTGTVAALRSTRYRGVNGSYNFLAGTQSTLAYPEETNDPSLGNAQLIFQVQQGAHVCLGPEPYSSGSFRWPETR